MNRVLLLTATVRPQARDGLVRLDPALRAADYQVALRNWLEQSTFDTIVLCDNSGFTVSEVRDLLRIDELAASHPTKTVEIITFTDEPDLSYHYGYSELGIIDYALKKSTLLSKSDSFVKVTGRLYYPSWHRLEAVLDPHMKFHLDCRSKFLFVDNQQVTTQLMVFSTNFYIDNLMDCRKGMTKDDYYIERFLYRVLIKYRGSEGCYFRWPIELMPIGVAAHSGRSYSTMRKNILSYVRSLARRVAPNCWI